MRERIQAIVSNPDGTYIDTWDPFRFDGFSAEINGGPGECVIRLSLPFDYAGKDVLEGNSIELRVSDADAASYPGIDATIVLYRGYISFVERDVQENAEGITVHLLGHYTRLGVDVLKSGSQTTLYSESSAGLTTTSGSQTASDIGKMVRAVMDRYIAETTNPQLSYDASDIPDTGTTATFRFERTTYRQALDSLLLLAPYGTYYYVNELGKLKFGQKPSTPTHRFVFGKHFNRATITRSLETLRNFVLVWNGDNGSPIYKHYQDDDSIALYGRRVATINAYGIDSSDAADLMGAQFIAANKTPEVRVRATIIDNNPDSDLGYDIETIRPGDTCSFHNFNTDLAPIFQENMLITKVDYTLDKAIIEVEVTRSGLLDFQARQSRDIGELTSGGLGILPTYS